jgi:hypothetical protein
MIVVFVEITGRALGRFEVTSKIPNVGEEVRLHVGKSVETFVVKKLVFEFFGSNDRHLLEIQVESIGV